MTDFLPLSWPVERLGELLKELAQVGKLSPHAVDTLVPMSDLADDGERLGRWVDTAVAHLGLEAESARIAYNDLPGFLSTAGPAFFLIQVESEKRFLALIRTRRKTAYLLTSKRRIQRLPLKNVRAVLSQPLEEPHLDAIEEMLANTAVSTKKQADVQRLILQEQLANKTINGCWLLNQSPGRSFWEQLRRAGFLRRAVTFVIAYFLQHFLFLFSWWVIGRAVFQGRVETSWLIAWILILLSLMPLNILNTWLQGILAVTFGGLLQKRLLFGAMRLHPDEIRHEGAGQLMGRVFEGEAIETLSLNGGISGLAALIELIMAGWVLALGAGGIVHALLLLIWLALIGAILVRFYHRRRRWTAKRRDLTHYLVEVMVGHRTRLAQTLRQHWHEGEDDDLADYIQVLDEVDRTAIILEALISHGWLVVGLAALIPAFVSGSSTPAALAISLGGVLSAELAFRKFALGLINQLLAAIIAWDQIAPLFKAATRPEKLGTPNIAEDSGISVDSSPQLLSFQNVSYRYEGQGERVLQQCNLQVSPGDRILLEGSSGGGKSTLAAILTGLREPESGLLFWGGLDRQTLGTSAWRRRLVFAPQFHENFIVGSTFLFNLLMGRRWPPHREDIEQAQILCSELGLGDLLSRMPAGLLQTVGDTGWQLSHGEKSRLYIARALLQGVDLIILDESFAALDPKNLQRAMSVVLERAPTLMVIAHP